MNPANRIAHWYAARGWEPFPFQRDTWEAYASGDDALIHAPTGMGKTLAAWLAPVNHWLLDRASTCAPVNAPEPIRVLWLTPLRALATDTEESLRAMAHELDLPWTVEKRTGDTSASIRARQKNRLPSTLITTPESLSLLLSYPDTKTRLRTLDCVVVDEWHELLGSKRGVQTELCLARLRSWLPNLRTLGLSATLGNLDEAARVLQGSRPSSTAIRRITGAAPRDIRVDTVIPADMDRFPWSGHLGLKLLPDVLDALDRAATTLLFTNTRSQAESWFRAVADARPQWEPDIALHHGSIARDARLEVEARLRNGSVRCVVCTSSLDLGVDFSPVEQVIQVGSPKGVARLLQRAGRSGHAPGRPSRVLCVPAHAFELIEFAAARAAIETGSIETRRPVEKPMDVLVQHLVTIALGGGFAADEMLHEIRSSHAYRELSDEEWQWALDVVTRGGQALQAYDQFNKVKEVDGRWTVPSRHIARMHRMSIGTITANQSLQLRYLNGGKLGTIEEQFLARLRPGDRFIFGGKVLELRRIHDGTAHVRRASGQANAVPVWMGGRMPLSSRLSAAVLQQLDQAARGTLASPEMRAVSPLLEIQQRWSSLPGPEHLLIEQSRSREGMHAFLFPLEGRHAHEGLAALLAFRLSKRQPVTLRFFATDYGLELLSPDDLALDEGSWRELLSPEDLLDDLHQSVNAAELSRRTFRDIAQVSGLVFQGYPGKRKAGRQLQASAGLLYEVFQRYDPGNRLLTQARQEVLTRQMDIGRIGEILQRVKHQPIRLRHPGRLTPFAFPIWAERVHGQVSTETWSDRVARMVSRLERQAAKEETVCTT